MDGLMSRVILDYPAGYWRLENEDYYNRILNVFPARKHEHGAMIKNVYSFFDMGFENCTFTVEFWLDTKSEKKSFIVMEGAAGGQVVRIFLKENCLYFEIDNYTAFKTIELSDNRTNVCCVYDQRTMQVYVNGVPGEKVTLPDSFLFSDVGEHFIVDNVFDLALFPKKLSENEIRAHLSWADFEPKEHKETLSDFFEDAL